MEPTSFKVDKDGFYLLSFVIPIPKVIDYNGAIVRYNPRYISPTKALKIFKQLRIHEDDAENARGITPAGKPYIAERKTLQISDPGIRVYKFNGSTALVTESFDKYPIISYLRTKVYEDTGIWCNFCLYNTYTPEAKLGWHSDSEKDMVENSSVISLSFGDMRRFRIRHKDKHETVKEFYLESGSILTMEGTCQKIMDHSIWDMTKKELETNVIHGLRINLTFRQMKDV